MSDIVDVDTIIRNYHTYADYDLQNDLGRAKIFRLACRQLLNPGVLEASRQHGPDIVQHNLSVVKDQLKEVEDWIKANDPANKAAYGVSRLDFTYFRG